MSLDEPKRHPRRGPQPGWEHFASLQGLVRLVLCVDWDPIDLFGVIQVLDEYDSYAAQVRALLEAGATVEELTAHLRSKSMFQVPDDRHVATATKLLRAYRMYRNHSDSDDPDV